MASISRNLNEWIEEGGTLQGRSIPGKENPQFQGSDGAAATHVQKQRRDLWLKMAAGGGGGGAGHWAVRGS